MTTVSGEQPIVAAPARHGDPWVETDHRQLIQCLQAGFLDLQVAVELERSVASIRAQAVLMVPADTPQAKALTTLRDLLKKDGHYDWLAAVKAAMAASRRQYWTCEREHMLAQGWVDAVPMTELVRRLGVTEEDVIYLLKGWKVAPDNDAIEARIGLIPNGNTAVRRKLAADKRSARLWCLVIAEGTSPPHISLHPTVAAADTARDEHLATHPPYTDVHWSIGERLVGAGDVGITTEGTVRAQRLAGDDDTDLPVDDGTVTAERIVGDGDAGVSVQSPVRAARPRDPGSTAANQVSTYSESTEYGQPDQLQAQHQHMAG